jgi:MSHA type pilus biogenesis protein MshL
MDENRPNRKSDVVLALFCIISLVWGCSSVTPPRKTQIDIKRDVAIPEEFSEGKANLPPPLKTPEFVPATEDISPLRTRIVNVIARSTALKDVLHVIAEATSLNVVMEKGVDPETPVNITLKNVSAEHALSTIFNSVDYFYTLKDNMLFVRAAETRAFELGQPALEQKYTVDIGGDMLAGASSAPSASGGGGSTGVKGSIEHGVKADETAFKFWDAVENSLAHLLGAQGGAATGPQAFTINRRAGSIIVTGSKKDLERVEQYVANLKKIIGRQVLVEAKIIEVQLSDNLKFGIDWSYISGNFAFSTANFASVVPAGGPVAKIAVTNQNFSPVLQALEQQGDVRILSNPRINMMNGQTALLSVGRNTSFVSNVESTVTPGTSGNIVTFTVHTGSILSGILIGMAPYINEKGEISLTVTPIISNLVALNTQNFGNNQILGISTNGGVQISLPVVDVREMSTTVKVLNGQTIIIGGLISKVEGVQDNQVPFLGSLPLIGYLFKSRDKQDVRSELVVLLKPYLITP